MMTQKTETRQAHRQVRFQNDESHHSSGRIPRRNKRWSRTGSRRNDQSYTRHTTIYRQTFKNGTLYFEELKCQRVNNCVDRVGKQYSCKCKDDFPHILTILPQLCEQFKTRYPGNWKGCKTHSRSTPEQQVPEESMLRVPMHPFTIQGDPRPPLYSVRQFDLNVRSVCLTEWPKILISVEAVLDGFLSPDPKHLYPEGFSIEVHRHPIYRFIRSRNDDFRVQRLREHVDLVEMLFPEGFLLRVPPNAIVLARGQSKNTPFSLRVHKPRNQCHRFRLNANMFNESGVQQQYHIPDAFYYNEEEEDIQYELNTFPEAYCCRTTPTDVQLELTQTFSPFHLAQFMFPYGLLVKVCVNGLLYDENVVVVKPCDIHIPLDFGGGRDGLVPNECLEKLGALHGYTPAELAKEFFPMGLVMNVDKDALSKFITPISDCYGSPE